jgi:hypothetical protein
MRQVDGLLESAEALRPVVEKAWETRRTAARLEKFEWPPETDAPIAIQMMLLAFAIENLLKASLVQNLKVEHERLLENDARLPKDLKAMIWSGSRSKPGRPLASDRILKSMRRICSGGSHGGRRGKVGTQ